MSIQYNVRVDVKYMERKLMKSGGGFALFLNSTILQLLKINPETDMIVYQVEGDKLIITKSKNKKQ